MQQKVTFNLGLDKSQSNIEQDSHNQQEQPAIAEMGDRLATTDMDRKVGAAVLLSAGGSWVPIITQCRLDQGLPPYQLAS